MDRRERLHREYGEDLSAAQKCAERAVNALSAEFGPKRGFMYRWRLKRANKALKRLTKIETNRED